MQDVSSGRCTCLMAHWRAVGNRINVTDVLQMGVSVCVSRDMLLTAMEDLMPCSWKKTFPPSSGHTVLISFLDIPRSSLPVSTPRLLTVLHMKRHEHV